MKIRSCLAWMAAAVLIPVAASSAIILYQCFVAAPVAGTDAAETNAIVAAVIGVLTSLICAAVAASVLSRKIVKALDDTRRSVQALGQEAFARLAISGVDEIDRLNEDLAGMARTLAKNEMEREQLLLRAQEGREFAERQSRAKDQFLATLGHELRNPLAPINTAAQILKLPSLDESQLELTREIIERQVEHLTRVVDDLVDVSRVSRGLIVLQRDAVDVNTVLDEAVEQVRPLIETKGHKLTVTSSSIPAWVSADRTRVVQVIVNLLHNAAKFTPHAGRIDLSVAVSVDDVTVTVRDNGAGIAADLLPNVFDLFTQSEKSPEHAQGGLGLGLSLVKGLVELHAGRVSAHSEGVGKGSEFTIELPRLAMPPAAVSPAGATGGEPMKIVIVDDNVDTAQSLAVFLRASFGYEVCVYADAKSALENMAQDAPNALVLDIGLPNMNGYELARKLRENPDTAKAVLIAVTGYGQQRDRELAKEAGFDHHLTKPADPMQIAELLIGGASWSAC